MLRSIAFLQLFSLISFTLHAGTIVDIQNQKKQQTQFLSDGKMGRMNSAGDRTYMIVDYTDQSIKVVMPKRSEVLDLGGEMPSLGLGGTPTEKVALIVEAEGEGPEVAGYATQKFKLSVNGESCGVAFASKEAMEDTGMDQMFKTLQKVAEKTSQAMGALQPDISPCERAKTNTANHIETMGAPLRSLDEKGNVEVEVTRIQTDISLPPDTFVIPAEYKVVSAADKMRQVESQLRSGVEKMQKNMPEMEKMLEEMERSGKMSPESMKNMKKMMKQYQPQQ